MPCKHDALIAALTARGYKAMDFHLEADEVGAMTCLLQLAMDTLNDAPVDLPSVLLLRRLPEETFANLSRKLTGAMLKMHRKFEDG